MALRARMVEGLSLPTGSLARLRSSLRTSLFRNSFFLLLSSAFGSGLGFLFWFALGMAPAATFVGWRRAGFGTIRTVTFGATRLPIPLLLAGSFGILGVFLAWSAALFVSLIVGAFVLLPRVATGYRALPSAEAPRAKGIFRYSLWNHATAITAAIPLSLLPLVILNSPEPTGGAEASAFFFAATAIGGVIYVVPYAFTTSLFVEGSHPEASFARDTRHAIGFSVAFLVTGVLAAIALRRW